MRLTLLPLGILLCLVCSAMAEDEPVRLKLRDGRVLEGVWNKSDGTLKLLDIAATITIREQDVVSTEAVDMAAYNEKKKQKFEAAQRKKGLVEVNGTWMTKAEAEAAAKAARAAQAQRAQAEARPPSVDPPAAGPTPPPGVVAETSGAQAAPPWSEREQAEVADMVRSVRIFRNKDFVITGKTFQDIQRAYWAIAQSAEADRRDDKVLFLNDWLDERLLGPVYIRDALFTGTMAVSLTAFEDIKAAAMRNIEHLAKPGVPLQELFSVRSVVLSEGNLGDSPEFRLLVEARSRLATPCTVKYAIGIQINGKDEFSLFSVTRQEFTYNSIGGIRPSDRLRYMEMAKDGDIPVFFEVDFTVGAGDAVQPQWSKIDEANRRLIYRNLNKNTTVYTAAPIEIQWDFKERLALETKIKSLTWTKAGGTVVTPYTAK